MNWRKIPLDPGLYLVATPIGNARDITLRALDVLASAEVIAAEDTRTARKLMEIHGIPAGDRPFVAYHDHSGPQARARLLGAVRDGRSVACLSEAGTPLVADPGFQLVRAAIEEGLPVTALPGASALLAALTIAGLPTDRFLFAGFLPTTEAARAEALRGLRDAQATVVLYESPKRIQKLLGTLCETHGEGCPVVICRELTKRFEEAIRGTAGQLRTALEGTAIKGECVVLIGEPAATEVTADDLDKALEAAMQTMRIKDAANAVAGALGLPRRDVYQRALSLRGS